MHKLLRRMIRVSKNTLFYIYKISNKNIQMIDFDVESEIQLRRCDSIACMESKTG